MSSIFEHSIWLDHPKYPGYRVSPEGGVLSVTMYRKPTLIMKASINKDGYKVVCLRKRNVFVHRLVAEVFVENKFGEYDFKKVQVNHKDGNKLNNHAENLEWITASQNQSHRYKILKKRAAIGEKSGSCKLNKEQVLQIRNRLSLGIDSMTALAKEFGVSVGNIHAIKVRRSWDCI